MHPQLDKADRVGQRTWHICLCNPENEMMTNCDNVLFHFSVTNLLPLIN
jgi:hypothetical protein